MWNECDEESEDRYNWLELARGGFPLPRMAAFKFAANKPRCLFLRCFLSCNTSVPLEKIFSWLTRWTFGSFEQLSIRFVFILDKVCRGMQSNFSRRKESNYLLWWNRQKPSTRLTEHKRATRIGDIFNNRRMPFVDETSNRLQGLCDMYHVFYTTTINDSL